MPIYEFVCKKCGSAFDRLVPFDWKTAGVQCSECGSTELDRVVSRIGGFSSGGKLKTAGDSCTSCSTGTCSTCH